MGAFDVIAALASIALSPWALGGGFLLALAATGGLMYLRAPASLIAIVWLIFAAHLYSGVIWQTATEACEARVAKAASDEAARQRTVQEGLEDKYQRQIAENDRADLERRKDKDQFDEAALHDPDALPCGMSASGVRRHNRLTAPDLRIADAALTKPAADPVRLPDRKLSQAEVERYWGTDALNLRVCKADKASLAGFYRDQIIALRKGPAAK